MASMDGMICSAMARRMVSWMETRLRWKKLSSACAMRVSTSLSKMAEERGSGGVFMA